MEKLKRAVIKEEYIAITGDMTEAVILNQFIYWSERVRDFDKFVSEENNRATKFLRHDEQIEIDLNCGWIYKKAAELKDEIMCSNSEKTISRKMNNLVEKGFLDKRKWDRTYQYRVNLINIKKALNSKGYELQDYKLDIEETLKFENGHIGDSKRHNDDTKRHGDGAIPETTTEITSKITKIINVVAPNGDNVKFFSAIFKYYFETYERYMGKAHPMLSEKYVKQIIDSIIVVSIDVYSDKHEIIKANDWEEMIDMYFRSNLDCDRNMVHFAQPEILYNRASNCELIE